MCVLNASVSVYLHVALVLMGMETVLTRILEMKKTKKTKRVVLESVFLMISDYFIVASCFFFPQQTRHFVKSVRENINATYLFLDSSNSERNW